MSGFLEPRSLEPEAPVRGDPFVVFRLGALRCSVEAAKVREVLFERDLTPLPSMPSFFEGVFRLRDTLVPVLDMRARFEVAPEVEGGRGRILLALVEPRILGLHVDQVHRVVRVAPGDVTEVPPSPGGIDPRFVRGAHEYEGEPCFILLLEEILSSEERLLLVEMPDVPESPGEDA